MSLGIEQRSFHLVAGNFLLSITPRISTFRIVSIDFEVIPFEAICV